MSDTYTLLLTQVVDQMFQLQILPSTLSQIIVSPHGSCSCHPISIIPRTMHCLSWGLFSL